MSKKIDWPLFGITIFKNPYFKFESRNSYVDIPNGLVEQFLEQLNILTEKYGNNSEKLYHEALKLKESWNNFFQEKYGEWLKFVFRKETFAKELFGVQVYINWDKFYAFLDDFATKNVSLEEKYEYLFSCRAGIAWMKSKPYPHLMEERVKFFSQQELKEIDSLIHQFIKRMDEIKNELREKSISRKHIFPLALAYISDILATLEVIKYCVNMGVLTTCYREMRKILENLSWAVIDDLLLFRRPHEFMFTYVPPYRVLSKKWLEWAGREDMIVKNLGELNVSFKNIAEEIYLFSRTNGYKVTRKSIKEILFNNLTYPSFLVIMGRTKDLAKGLEEWVPSYDITELRNYVEKDLCNTLLELKGKTLSDHDSRFVKKLVENLLNQKTRHVVPPYPSNAFVIQFVGKTFNLDLNGFYSKYSYFVHSYDKSWQLIPFSSVVEFKIFKHELTLFMKLILEMMDSYKRIFILKRAKAS
jgi:hypothetical protein